MSRSLSWIDPSAVEEALSRAHCAPGSRRPAAPAPAPPSTALDAAASEVLQAPSVGDPYVPDASRAPRMTGALAERLRNLAVWVEAEIGPARWFLADDQGMGLHAAGVSETDMVASAVLARALRPLRGLLDTERVEAVHLELSGGRTLYTVWCDTGLGRVAVGLQDPRGLTNENVQKLRRWLRDALSV